MRCSKIKILISASLDGELTGKEKLILEQHVSKCGECAREMEALKGLRIAMSSWKDEEPSERLALSFSYKLRDLADNKDNIRARRPSALIFGKAAAGLAVIVALVGFFIRNDGNDSSVVAVLPMPAPISSPVSTISGNIEIKQDVERPVSKSTNTGRAVSRIGRQVAKASIKTQRRPLRKPVLVAYTPRNDFRTAELASRHAESVIMKKMAYARSVDGETAATVVNNLDEANLKMNESFERVRGTLRTAADLLSAERQSSNGNAPATDGDTTL